MTKVCDQKFLPIPINTKPEKSHFLTIKCPHRCTVRTFNSSRIDCQFAV